MTLVGKFKERKGEWVAKNPLRVWRKEHDFSGEDAATALDLTREGVYGIERGSWTVTEETFRRIAKGMRTTLRDLREAWEKWEREKPTL